MVADGYADAVRKTVQVIGAMVAGLGAILAILGVLGVIISAVMLVVEYSKGEEVDLAVLYLSLVLVVVGWVIVRVTGRRLRDTASAVMDLLNW